MPRLVVFAACQKVIISERDDSLSLIALLENIAVPVPEGVTIPTDAKVGNNWDIIAYWRPTLEDNGRKYEQRTELVLPNGEETLDTIMVVDTTGASIRNVVNVSGFPVGYAGECHLRLWLRDAETDEPWQHRSDYILSVTHETQVPEDDK